jgi:hypothetical protein
MKSLAQIFTLLLAVALPSAANAQVRLTDVLTFGADASGSLLFQPDVWDTEPGDNYNNWLQSVPAGTFLNGPSNAAVQPNITLTPGTNSFRVYGSPGVDNANFGINLFFNGAQTPSISAFGPMLTSADQVHSFAADSASPTPTPVPVYNSGIPGAGTLTFTNGNQVITLTDFYWATPSVYNVDLVGGRTLGSDGVMDYVGGFTLVLTTNTPPDCTPAPAGLVAWWPGEGNANDIIGTNNGTLSSSGATYAGGQVGLGFRLDGTNGYVQIPDSDVLKPTNVTAEAWVWLDPNVTNNGGEYIIFKRNTWTYLYEGYALAKGRFDNGNGTYTDRFQFLVTRNGNQVALNSTTVAQRGVWYHVAGTYDGNKSTLWVNGVAESSATPGFALDYGTRPVFIGTSGEPAPYTGYLAGIIDEPSIYNRALSTNEIAAIYNAGSAGKCEQPSIVQQPVNQTTVAGAGAALTVSMGGAGPFCYQWRFNGVNLAGATNATLTLANLHANQSGAYSVVVTTPDGMLTSSAATVTVLAQTTLAYNYFGTQKTITLGVEASANFSGQMFFIPAGTNGVFVGWANLNGKKQYWVTPFADYLLVTIPGSSGHVYTVLGKAGDSWDANGQPHIWAYLHQGLNTSLTVGARQKFSFPNTFTCNDTHLYPDANTGNLVLSQSNSTYTFLSPTTQTANNNGQTLIDLVNALTQSLVKQGYQKQ